MMDFILKQNTCFGVQEYCLPREKVGPLEADCIRHYDQSIADLICLFLEEECTGEGITTPEQLFERERARNYADGKALYGYAATLEHGAWLSTTQIKNIFHFIWKSPLFGESTGMDLGMIQLFRTIEKTDDPDELLFWSFRFCAWGGYDNMLPYTLYRWIVDGKLERFYNYYPEWQHVFLCPDNAGQI